MNRNKRQVWLGSTAVGAFVAVSLLSGAAFAAETVADGDIATMHEQVIVTGSRIKRAETMTATPLSSIDTQTMVDKGMVQAGDILNLSPAVVASVPLAAGDGSAAGDGRQYPNLFGMGAARTLTLVNGRRFVASQAGMDGNAVDTNSIPAGLIDRVDIIPAGGAAVYGSDAIAGVINYVLKKNFEGVEFDAQGGLSSRGDYPTRSVRATAGTNFDGGKGNIAADISWSKTDPLYWSDRPRSNIARVTVSSGNTNPSDGISSVKPITDTRFWEFNTNGVIFTTPAPVSAFLLKTNGSPTQFSADGSALATYNTGTLAGIPFASGGDGYSYRNIAALMSGVERYTGAVVGHYDFSSHFKVSTELNYSRTIGTDPIATYQSNTVLNGTATGSGYIAFTKNNAYLTSSQISALSAASTTFANGGPLFLSKLWSDLLPSESETYRTDTYRALLSASGDFNALARDFYWEVSVSHGVTDGADKSWGSVTANLNKAVNAVKNSTGQIVCSVNADASTANDDAACVPVNIFGTGTVSAAARQYITAPVGERYQNTQEDFLATLGGDLMSLPAGKAGFSVAYEHRKEKAVFNPAEANQLGLIGDGTPTVSTRGAYETNEYSAEVMIPVLGSAFILPYAKELELDGAFRYVDNTIAGQETVWSTGARWKPFDFLTLRGSRSRNFRAPTLTQIFAPTSTSLGSVGQDPCDYRYINAGPAPATRLANCQAEWLAAGRTIAQLATFQNDSTNFDSASVTTGGNRNLQNEVSNTTTFGFVFQPDFIDGLVITADRYLVDLTNGLSTFEPENFMATCYDSSVKPADVCGTFSRDPATGNVISARTTTYNAGSVKMRGELYHIDYFTDPGAWFGYEGFGTTEFLIEANHLAFYETSVTGYDLNRTDGTTAQPEWQVRFDINWTKGPWRASYSAYFLSDAKRARTDTIENTPTPYIPYNLRHSVSVQYELNDYVTLRAGIKNLTDEEPSYPTLNYGDILGRQYYGGIKIRL